MKILCSLLLCVALATSTAAQTSLAGKWQGRLEVAPGKSIAIHFVIKQTSGGGYSAIMTSPDEGAIKNVQARSVTFADSRLAIDVPELSGSYAGSLRNGILEGEWTQEGAKLPLSLKPFTTPTLTRADIDLLRGEWIGKLDGGGGTLTIVLRFSSSTDAALQAVFDVPEQGVKDWAATNVTLDDGHFSVEMPRPRARFTGKLSGNQIVGQWHQNGNSLPLTVKKGRYAAAAHYLDLPADARAKLEGRWRGTLNGLAVIVSFSTDAQGRTLGLFDSTQQGLKTSITKAQLAGAKLSFAVSYGATYQAELAGGTLTGEWTQAGFPKPLPLVLTREQATAPIAQDMTPETAAPYLGLYWVEPLQKPMIVVLHNNRLALEMPWRTLRELQKTSEEHVWSYVTNPNNLVKFHRNGAGPAAAMELRQESTNTVPRFEPENGLPGLDELFARRPDPQRAKKLGALGTIRMSGGIERTTSQEKGSFELLSAGEKHSQLKLNLDGGELRQVVAGSRAWMQPQASSPAQEMPESLARATRRAGWLLASGDWRGEFKQRRVLKRIALDGKPAFLVHAAPERGRHRLVYLDTGNGLTLGYDEVYEIPGVGMVGCEVRFADYREVEGVQIPFRSSVKYSTRELGTWTYRIENIETHLKLAEDPFTIN